MSDKPIRVGINGFGRIGKLVYRVGHANPEIEFVAVNDLADVSTLAHLLKYDSTHRVFDAYIQAKGNALVVDGNTMEVFNEKDPAKLPWSDRGVDLVIESTGAFRTREYISKHLEYGGAKYVILTVPSKKPEDVDNTVVLGVNDHTLDFETQRILSNASCTTNCLAPMVYVLHKEYGVEKGLMTTVHAYTNDQRTIDFAHTDLRRARTAASNIIPTSTGAAKAIGLVIPELADKIEVGDEEYNRMDGFALRVPVDNGSVTDLTVLLKPDAVTVGHVQQTFWRYANGSLYANDSLASVLEYTEEPIVSTDIIGNPKSCIVDGGLTMVAGGNLLKVVAWYDNEWGYSNRVVDLATKIGAHLREN